MGKPLLNNLRRLLEQMLMFEFWMKRSTFWTVDNEGRNNLQENKAKQSVIEMLDNIKSYCPHQEGCGWKITKFHETLHLIHYMTAYGTPENFQSGPNESHHIALHKRPSSTAQKQGIVFGRQAASRMADSISIDRSYGYCRDRFNIDLNLSKASANDGIHTPNQNYTHPSMGATMFRFRLCEVKNKWVIQWKKKKDRFLQLYPGLKDYIIQGILSALPPNLGSRITFYTEYRLDENTRVRSHPSYRKGRPWYDWVKVRYQVGDKEYLVPAMVATIYTTGKEEDSVNLVVWTSKRYVRNERESGHIFEVWNMLMDRSGSMPKFSVVERENIHSIIYVCRDIQEIFNSKNGSHQETSNRLSQYRMNDRIIVLKDKATWGDNFTDTSSYACRDNSS